MEKVMYVMQHQQVILMVMEFQIMKMFVQVKKDLQFLEDVLILIKMVS